MTVKQILIFLEAVFHRCSSRKVLLKTCNFIKKRLQHRCFPVNLLNKNTFFHRTSPVVAFVFSENKSKIEKIYSHKFIHRKMPVIVSFLVQLKAWGLTVLQKKGLHRRCFLWDLWSFTESHFYRRQLGNCFPISSDILDISLTLLPINRLSHDWLFL